MQFTENTDLKYAGPETVSNEITKILIEKKGLDIRLYNVKETNSITDYYINVTGRSATHVSALADDITTKISERGLNELRVEGRRGGSWILVDYGDVIVNIFDKESREFYNFDRLLPEDKRVCIDQLVKEVDEKMMTTKE